MRLLALVPATGHTAHTAAIRQIVAEVPVVYDPEYDVFYAGFVSTD